MIQNICTAVFVELFSVFCRDTEPTHLSHGGVGGIKNYWLPTKGVHEKHMSNPPSPSRLPQPEIRKDRGSVPSGLTVSGLISMLWVWIINGSCLTATLCNALVVQVYESSSPSPPARPGDCHFFHSNLQKITAHISAGRYDHWLKCQWCVFRDFNWSLRAWHLQQCHNTMKRAHRLSEWKWQRCGTVYCYRITSAIKDWITKPDTRSANHKCVPHFPRPQLAPDGWLGNTFIQT